MPNEFAGITGYSGWKTKLDQLLAIATTASQGGTPAQRRKIAERLIEFAMQSPDRDGIPELDTIALDASRTILLDNIAGAVDSIAARTASIVAMTKQLGEIGRAAEEQASSIRLERARRMVDAMTEIVRAADDLDSVLTDDDKVLRAKIKKIADALLDLRGEVEESLGRRDT
ncbi:MAG TPA: hypothetical protein VF777_12610 [Phycisphaerales bacterium]